MAPVPQVRIRAMNALPVREEGKYVLLWMTAARRTRRSFALDRALEHARALDRPLLVLEALRCGYRWASDRLHRFVLEGMADNAARCAAVGVVYHPYAEPRAGAGKGLLAALSRDACVVVGDDWPCFFLPRMLAAAARQVPVLLEAVDGNGLVPVRSTPQAFSTAHAFRRWLQRHLPDHIARVPAADPLARARLPDGVPVPRAIARRWPRASARLLAGDAEALGALPIDHAVEPVPYRGGPTAGGRALRAFVRRRLPQYAERRNEPDAQASSGLSPWLHFGHVAAHDVVLSVLASEGLDADDLAPGGDGSREGWWGASASAEAFLDQVVTWRELGHNLCVHRPDDYDAFDSLPAWALRSLEEHARDPRPHRYRPKDLEEARTHDPLWNAAQTQLRREGRIHNYLRMLWAKKVLEWTGSPREAARVLVRLNDRYAVDGRDPNSYAGIYWALGRYDRPWAPRRPVFGTVRYMSSERTRRKLPVREYLERFGPASGEGQTGFASSPSVG
ncbi:MAG TPA: deoxyribodipyrimidine photolyase [Planctomycetota bacterium]|nr:deoxyribodipyrimidine photolyase [Planctomycetota bacterium]